MMPRWVKQAIALLCVAVFLFAIFFGLPTACYGWYMGWRTGLSLMGALVLLMIIVVGLVEILEWAFGEDKEESDETQ